ncbi:hypothetical protein LSH36_277g00004 [Paralvinella palmiformis]|uniref:Uncharacterized protein n=1 Tax=Paralvinella palmiformis TaxID=53620 RepID=A0AAD9JJC9_9ANNE|nr:hypothetical protein LSH36_277g00004 [Paralvinella palmiformis]
MEVQDEETPITDNDNFNYNAYNFEFSEKSIRLGFIRKVYGILLCQLLVTIIFITLFLYIEPLREYSYNNPWLWGVSFAMTFMCIIVLACCPDVRRQWPINFIMLALFWDFTMCNGMLFVLVIVLLCFGMLAMIIQNYYIVFDTQMMLGGKHKYSLSPEEYIFAALNLYLDIINLFMFILSLIGGARQ